MPGDIFRILQIYYRSYIKTIKNIVDLQNISYINHANPAESYQTYHVTSVFFSVNHRCQMLPGLEIRHQVQQLQGF